MHTLYVIQSGVNYSWITISEHNCFVLGYNYLVWNFQQHSLVTDSRVVDEISRLLYIIDSKILLLYEQNESAVRIRHASCNILPFQ